MNKLLFIHTCAYLNFYRFSDTTHHPIKALEKISDYIIATEQVKRNF